MFKYTISAINNSLDIVKKLIYILQILIQVSYIGFLAYKIIFDNTYFIINIILTVISFVYLIIFIFTSNEFYTEEDKQRRKIIKYVFKIIKYIINIYLIVITTNSLIINQGSEPVNIILLIMMILGLIVNIIFDIVLEIINKQAKIINNAILYDATLFQKNKAMTNLALKTVLKIDLSSLELTDEKSISKLDRINNQQVEKKRRKRDFIFEKRQKRKIKR